jgi:hypothetical protein
MLGAVLSLVFLALAGSATAAAVLLPDCGSVTLGAHVEPKTWSSGCTGGSANLDDLAWTNWGAKEALAGGIVHYNDCTPDCAEGSVYDYPASLRIGRIRQCASPLGPRRYYTRFTVQYFFPPGNAVGRPAGPGAPFTFTSNCPSAKYLVATRGKHAAFGAFKEGGDFDADQLESYYGKPSSRRRHGITCTKRWRKFGLLVKTVAFGGGKPCVEGSFASASLTSRRWHTRSGLRPGSSARKARRVSTRRCRSTCGVHGYILGLHRIDCALGRFPNVIAVTRHGRVRRLLVLTHTCE